MSGEERPRRASGDRRQTLHRGQGGSTGCFRLPADVRTWSANVGRRQHLPLANFSGGCPLCLGT
jgi:hypothetical protein